MHAGLRGEGGARARICNPRRTVVFVEVFVPMLPVCRRYAALTAASIFPMSSLSASKSSNRWP